MAEGGNTDDGLWMLFFIVAFICVGAWGIWTAFKPQLLQGFLWVRQGEMAVASLYTDSDYSVDVVIGGKQSSLTFGEAQEMVRTLTPRDLLNEDVDKWELMAATTLVAAKPLRIPYGIIFGLMIYYAMFHGPTSAHRKKFTLDRLIKMQSSVFPVIKPFVEYNPLKGKSRIPGDPVPAELPLFAEALSPEEWTAFHRIPLPDGKVDHAALDRAFSKQLGEKWQGVGKLAPYLQILLAAFALKASRKRDECDTFLSRAALCWDHKSGLKLSRDKGLLREARKILKNKDTGGLISSTCNRHAYITTAMIGALEKARTEGGVLAPAQFLWLRGHDRDLWYPLNNLGRRAFHLEAIGAMSHYRSEKQVKRPIPKPMMLDAIKALDTYLQDEKNVKPIPQLDFSMIKNKKAPKKNQGVMKPVGT